MTAIPYINTSRSASARYYSANATPSLLDNIRPQSVEYSGLSPLWSYNSSTGVFTLDSTCTYVFEAALFVSWSTYNQRSNMQYGIVDASTGTEIADGYRGVLKCWGAVDYYNSNPPRETGDEVCLAVVDGSSNSTVALRYLANYSSVGAVTFTVDPTPSATYYTCASRLLVREYQP